MIKLLLKYHYSRISKKAAGLSGFLLSAACFGQAGIQSLTSQMPNNSKYSEFFPGDTLRQIGTVLLNTKTERVFQFAGDTITFYTGVYNQKTGRWLSTDPLFKSYPYASPYHYANNRPTSCIDIEGLAGVDVNGGTDPPNPPVFTIGLFGQLSISNKGFSFTGGIGGQISMKGFSAALNLTNAGKGRAVSVNAFCTVNSMATVGMSYNFPRTSFNIFAAGNKTGSYAQDKNFLKDGVLPGNDIKEPFPNIFPGLRFTLSPATQTLFKAVQDKFNSTVATGKDIGTTSAGNSTLIFNTDYPGALKNPVSSQDVSVTTEKKVSNNIAAVNQDPSGAYTGMPGVFVALNTNNQDQTSTQETNSDETQQDRNEQAVMNSLLQRFIKAHPLNLNRTGN